MDLGSMRPDSVRRCATRRRAVRQDTRKINDTYHAPWHGLKAALDAPSANVSHSGFASQPSVTPTRGEIGDGPDGLQHIGWRLTEPGRPFGLDGKECPLEFRMLHVIEFADNGHIKRENVWIKRAAVIRQRITGIAGETGSHAAAGQQAEG